MRFYIVILLFIILIRPMSIHADDNDRWHLYMDASAVNRITCIGDSLWCGTQGGILIFNLEDSTFTQYLDGLGFNFSNITSIPVDGNGSIWGGFKSGGVFRIDDPGVDPEVKIYSEISDAILSDSVTCILPAGNDIYYGSTRGVAKFYNNIHSTEQVLTDSLIDIGIHDMVLEGNFLWVGSSEGIARFNRVSFDYELFRIGKVTSICKYDNNIYCVCGSEVRTFEDGNWLAVGSLPVTPVAISSGGGILACVSANRVYEWSGLEWTEVYGYSPYDSRSLRGVIFDNYRISRSNPQLNLLRTIAVDDHGVPWVGGYLETQKRGAYISGAAEDRWFNKAPVLLTQNEVIELSLDPNGGIWFSALQYGVGYLGEDGVWNTYTKYRGDIEGDNGLSYFAYNLGFFLDSRRSLWIMSPHYFGDRDMDMLDVGIAGIKDDDEWEHYSLGDRITSDQFVKIKEDPGGNVWFLSDEFSVINIRSADGNNWLYIDENDGLESGQTFDCAFHTGGRIYLALREYGVQEWYTGGYSWSNLSSSGIWTTILTSENMASTKLYSIAVGEEGDVWTGTASGVVSYKNGTIDSLTQKTNTGDEGLVGTIAYDLEFDGNGNLWVATDGGLDKINSEGEVLETYTSYAFWNKNLQFKYSEEVISPLISHVCKALEYDAEDNVLWIGTDDGLAVMDLSVAAEEDMQLEGIVLYPNPVYISRGDESLKIARITGTVDIQIYTLEGELVHEAYNISNGEDVWDLRTQNYYLVRSGVYMVRVTSGGISAFKKVAVVK